MASSSPLDPDSSPARSADPAADLALLARARSAVDVDQMLDFGPRWYAPLLATMIGGLTLFSQDTTSFDNIVSGVVAVTASGILGVHDHRRRAVRLGRATPRGVAVVAIILAVCWTLVAAWGTAVSSIGYERFVPGYAAVAWVLTTVALLGLRAGFEAARRRRPRVL